jgi:hypothetical protein
MKKRSMFVAALALAGAFAPSLAGWWHPGVDFNFGPGDHRYLEGFEPMWEIDPDGVATHWSTYESIVRLPIRPIAGKARVSYRFARVYRETAQIEIRVNGVPADRFSVGGGAYQVRSVEIPPSVLERQPLEIHLAADSHERKNRGLRMDWLRVEPVDHRGRTAPTLVTVLWSMGLCLAFGVLALVTNPKAYGVAWAVPLGLCLYGGLGGPFPLAHMLRWVAPAGISLSVVVAAAYRLVSRKTNVAGSEWIPVLILTAFLLRAGGVFHPNYYHPDLRAHADMTRIVSEAGFAFWAHPSQYITEQGVWTAESMGKMYAFPFSPVFHALFVPLRSNLITTMEAMKFFACLLSCLEIAIVFFLARRLGVGGAAIWAAALVVVSPPILSRLSLAFLAALFAHWWDSLVLASLASLPERRVSSFALSFLFLLVALGSYAGSLINFGLFVPLFGLTLINRRELRRTAWVLLGGSAAIAAVALTLVYREFLGVFLSEMLPRFFAGVAEGGEGSLVSAVHMFFHRSWIFYDGIYLPFAIGGALLLVRRRLGAFDSRFLTAWALVYVILIFLRTAAPDLFAKVKEMLWVAPLVCLLTGEALTWIEKTLPAGRWLAVTCYAALAAYGIHFYVKAIGTSFDLAR